MVYAVTFSPDGRTLVSVGGEGDIKEGGRKNKLGEAKLWDVATGKELASLEGHTGPVSSAAFSPDGKQLATSTPILDGTVNVWDPATGKLRSSLQGQQSWGVRSVAFSPDGKVLAGANVN